MNQVRVPSHGTCRSSLLWSLWPYCCPQAGNTSLRSFREVREGILLNIVHSWWVWLSFASFFHKHLIQLQCAPPWTALTAAAAHWPIIYTICQVWQCQCGDTSWVLSTCPWCCCMGGPDQMALSEESEVLYLYLTRVGMFTVSDHELCDSM